MAKNDNRMGWIRNIEKLSKKDADSYFIEYEIATECHIAGVLDYNNGMILCGGLTIEKDQNGLYHYLIRLKYSGVEEPYYNNKANKKGYYFKDGALGELLAILSLFFQCRFYLVATFSGELTNHGLKIKTENRFTYKPCNPLIHPPIFSTQKRNFAIGLTNFLDTIKSLDTKYHQQFILACYHYTRSLKEIGNDNEMVFIRLVSAIESLSKFIKLNKNKDLFNGKAFEDIVKKEILSKTEMEELKKTFENRKSKARFITFVKRYSVGCFKGGNYKAKHCKITKKQLPNVLRTIYDARSAYLHNGEPMYLSQPMHGGEKWDTDPSMGMIIDNKSFSVSQKLPFTYFFEGIVRQCLLNFLKNNKLNK
jgi:hypothetical protein